MTISEKLNLAEGELIKNLPFINEFVIKDCINLIKTYYLSQLVYKNSISLEEFLLIKDINCCQETIYGKNIHEIIGKMYNSARDSSNGACCLKKIFVNREMFEKEFPNEVKDAKEIKFLNAKITLVDSFLFENDLLIGISESKFKYIEPNMLITIGQIKVY